MPGLACGNVGSRVRKQLAQTDVPPSSSASTAITPPCTRTATWASTSQRKSPQTSAAASSWTTTSCASLSPARHALTQACLAGSSVCRSPYPSAQARLGSLFSRLRALSVRAGMPDEATCRMGARHNCAGTPWLAVFAVEGAARSRRHALGGVRFADLPIPLPRHACTGALSTRCPPPLRRHA